MKFKLFKRLVNKHFESIKKDMGLSDWNTKLIVGYDHRNDKDKEIRNAPSIRGYVIKADWKYREAEIYFYARKHIDEKDVINTIKHELGHVLVSGYEYLLDEALKELANGMSADEFIELKSVVDEYTATTISRIKLRGNK